MPSDKLPSVAKTRSYVRDVVGYLSQDGTSNANCQLNRPYSKTRD